MNSILVRMLNIHSFMKIHAHSVGSAVVLAVGAGIFSHSFISNQEAVLNPTLSAEVKQGSARYKSGSSPFWKELSGLTTQYFGNEVSFYTAPNSALLIESLNNNFKALEISENSVVHFTLKNPKDVANLPTAFSKLNTELSPLTFANIQEGAIEIKAQNEPFYFNVPLAGSKAETFAITTPLNQASVNVFKNLATGKLEIRSNAEASVFQGIGGNSVEHSIEEGKWLEIGNDGKIEVKYKVFENLIPNQEIIPSLTAQVNVNLQWSHFKKFYDPKSRTILELKDNLTLKTIQMKLAATSFGSFSGATNLNLAPGRYEWTLINESKTFGTNIHTGKPFEVYSITTPVPRAPINQVLTSSEMQVLHETEFQWKDQHPLVHTQIELIRDGSFTHSLESFSPNRFIYALIPGKYNWRLKHISHDGTLQTKWSDWSEFEVQAQRIIPGLASSTSLLASAFGSPYLLTPLVAQNPTPTIPSGSAPTTSSYTQAAKISVAPGTPLPPASANAAIPPLGASTPKLSAFDSLFSFTQSTTTAAGAPPVKKELKNFYLMPSVLYDSSSHTENGVDPYHQFALTARVNGRLKLLIPLLEAFGSVRYTVKPITQTYAANAKTFAADSRLSLAMPLLIPQPWRLSIQAGGFYTTQFVDFSSETGQPYFGFSDMLGPQFAVSIQRFFATGDYLQFLVKFSPILAPPRWVSFYNREISAQLALVALFPNGSPVQFSIDASTLQLVFPGIYMLNNSISFGVGYGI